MTPADIDWDDIQARLAAPFPPDQIGSFEMKKGGKRLTFINAEMVMDRLDQVVGPENWSDAYTPLDRERHVYECTLTIHGVSKADAGYPNSGDADEPIKEAYSDAIKRAAVKWGIARYFNDYASGKRRNPSTTHTTEQPAQPTEQSGPTTIPHASPYKAASANQLATVAKLSRLLGRPEEPAETMTSAEASERITELSREFNEKKGTSGRRSA